MYTIHFLIITICIMKNNFYNCLFVKEIIRIIKCVQLVNFTRKIFNANDRALLRTFFNITIIIFRVQMRV